MCKRLSVKIGILLVAIIVATGIFPRYETSRGLSIVRQTNKAGADVILYRNIDAVLMGIQYVYDGQTVVVLERPVSTLDDPLPTQDR